jgi:hypothetical protein
MATVACHCGNLHHRQGHAEEDDFGDSVPRWTNVQIGYMGEN